MFRQLFSISKDGDFTAFLGNLCQCLATLTGKTCFLAFTQSLCVSVCTHHLLFCHGAPLKGVSLHPLCTLPSDIYVHWWALSLLFLWMKSPSSLIWLMLQSLNHPSGFLQNSLQYVHISLEQWSPEMGSSSAPGMASENAEQRGQVCCHWH